MAKSKKMNMEISDKDKKLLLVLLALLMIGASYMFGYKKLTEKVDEYKTQYSEMKVRQADLEEKQEKIDEYEAEMKVYDSAFNAIIAQYGNGITQTFQIDFLNRLERATNMWISSVSFQTATPVYTFGNISTSNPSGSGNAYSTDLVGYKNTLTLAYEGQYEDWKSFIEYLNTYFSKNVIESISMSYSDVTGDVSGSMTLAVYSIVGGDNTYVEPEFDIQTGTENIFMSQITGAASVVDATGDYIFKNYDYYMKLNPAGGAMEALIAGRKDDITGESIVSSGENEAKDGKIKLDGKDGSYTISYSIGDESYSEKCNAGTALELLIISSGRISDDDDVGINLTVENNSDIPINIKVSGDDENNRVKFKQTTGDVVIY